MGENATQQQQQQQQQQNRVLVIKEKINSVFCNVYSNRNNLNVSGFIIQFWASTETSSSSSSSSQQYNNNNNNDKKQVLLLLTTQNQPFALDDPCFSRYRSSCLRYQYCYTITCTNRYPELLPDLRLLLGLNPLLDFALGSRLTSSFFLPVFDHDHASSSPCCVGLVECSINRPNRCHLLVLFHALKTALQIVGLNTFRVQACRPYENTQGLTRAANEIENVLQSVCASHGLPLGHVWIAYQDDSTQTKQIFGPKLFGYCDNSDNRIKEYYDTCAAFPLKIGEGFVGKTLQTYDPIFCKNMYKLATDYGQLDSLDIKCSCLAISLKSIHTGDDVDYAFEFLWPKTRNYLFLLESLILTLQKCLPSFKFSSGAQLGDELHILDVQNSTGHGTGFFKILQRNHLSQVPQRSLVDIQVRERDYSVVEQHNANSTMDDATSGRGNKELSEFLAAFPIHLHCTATQFFPHMWVFWTQSEQPQSKLSSGAHNSWVIQEKIKSAFLNVYSSHLNGLIQFWAPVESSGRWLLSTSNEPFALAHLDSSFRNYRLRSLNYQYSINVNKFEVENDPMIINGGLASAFKDQRPQVVQNFKAHQGNPLMRCAAECGLTCSLLLPVFIHPFQSSSPRSCIGVLECSIKGSGLLVMFNELKRALESVGLHTFHAQESQPHKNMQGLKNVSDEIEDAIKIVCESHHITLAQVWVAYKKDKDMPSSSSVEETQMKQMYAVRLTGYCVDSNDDIPYSVKEYYDMCDVLALKIGDGLSGKTIQTYEPHICRNINKLSDSGLLALLPANTECSCLAICLRSIHTGDIDYAFEFLWPQNRYNFFLLESLLVTLGRRLPSFKFASGAQLGDELSTLRTRFVAGDCILSSEANPIILNWQEHDHYGKRKYSDLLESGAGNNTAAAGEGNQGQHSHSSSSSVRLHNDHALIITAKYKDRRTAFYLPAASSTNLADVKKYIADKYDLDPDSHYKLEYLWDNDWVILDDDEDWEICIQISKSLRNGQPLISLRILC